MYYPSYFTISYISLSILGASESDKESILSEIPTCEVKRDQVFYDLTFDNINQKVGVRHHVRCKKNKVLNMVQTYATLERVGSKGLSSVQPSSDTIKGIKMGEMLPSENDEKVLQQELSIMVSRILTTHVPAVAGLDTQWSIPHQYSAQSALKSDIISDLKILSSSAAIMLFVHNIMLIQTHNFQFRKKKFLEKLTKLL